MKYLVFVVFIIFLGCSGEPKYISNSKRYSSFDLDYHDFEEVVQSNIKSLKKSEGIKEILKDDDQKVLVISDITNNTKENIDLDILSKKLAAQINKNKLFLITNALNGDSSNTEAMIEKIRKLREEKEFNQNNNAQKGILLLPDYSLSGKISQNIKNVGDKERSDYLFLFSLTDLKTGILVWNNDMVISKVIKKENLDQYSSLEEDNDKKGYRSKSKDEDRRWSPFINIEFRQKFFLIKNNVEGTSYETEARGYPRDLTLSIGPTYNYENFLLAFGVGVGIDFVEYVEKNKKDSYFPEEAKVDIIDKETGYLFPLFIEAGMKDKNQYLVGFEYNLGELIDMLSIYIRLNMRFFTLKIGYMPYLKAKKTFGLTLKGSEFQGAYVSVGLKL